MKLNTYEALVKEYKEIVSSMEQTIDETYQAWKDAGCPPDSEWSIDLDVDAIQADHRHLWDMALNRALRDGCPEADVDRAEAELSV